MKKSLLMIICFSLMSINAFAQMKWEYQDTTEGKVTRYNIKIIEETAKTLKYLSAGPTGSSEFLINKNDGATLSWKMTRPEKTIFGVRNGNTIEIKVTERGISRSEVIKIKNKIWIQKMSLGLQWFVNNRDKEKQHFFIIRPEDFSPIYMVAGKKEEEVITIVKSRFDAINVIVSLSGWKSVFWKADYWFKHKLTDADFEGKTEEEIDEIYDKARTDFKLYSKKRLKKQVING